MRAEGRHVPHMSPFTVELILTAVHCLLIGRPRAPSSPTAREMPRGVAVASIARLPSSTDDPPASGSTADRHEPVEDWGKQDRPCGVWVSRGQTSTKTVDGRKLLIRFTLTAVLLVI